MKYLLLILFTLVLSVTIYSAFLPAVPGVAWPRPEPTPIYDVLNILIIFVVLLIIFGWIRG